MYIWAFSILVAILLSYLGRNELKRNFIKSIGDIFAVEAMIFGIAFYTGEGSYLLPCGFCLGVKVLCALLSFTLNKFKK